MNPQLQHHLPIYLRGAGPGEPRAITMATTSPHLNKGKSFFYEKAAMIGHDWNNSGSDNVSSRSDTVSSSSTTVISNSGSS